MWEWIRGRFEGWRRSRLAAIIGVVVAAAFFAQQNVARVDIYAATLKALAAGGAAAAFTSFIVALWHGREVSELGAGGVTGRLGEVADATGDSIDLIDRRLTAHLDELNARLDTIERRLARGAKRGA